MDRLKAGYEKLKKMDPSALKSDFDRVAAPVMQKLMPAIGRQHSIGSRVVAENRQISEGGFAYVWLVHDVKTHEELVLKKMRCQDKLSLQMAKREIQLLEQLPPHPNLVQYYGHILLTEGKSKEVAMLFEFCPGGHLLNLLEKFEGKLSEKVILETVSQVVAGVAVLHGFTPPVQHRDLKVENVLMGSDGHWKLLDFGSWSDERFEPGSLDKHALSQLEEQIDKYTTMMYRPPEMVDFYLEFPICQKVDIWMIGCILYTLMFYRHPFQDESTLAISNCRYPWPSTPEYPDNLRELTHWLLARDPEDRPDAELLLDILGNFDESMSLPLPKAVQEQSEKFRRLYMGGPEARIRSSPTSRVQSPAARSQPDLPEEERTRSKQRKGRQSSKKRAEEIWAQAEAPAWPAAAVPEPSSSWAAFGQDEPDLSGASPSSGRKSGWDVQVPEGQADLDVGQSSWSFST
ncbi:Probable serine/threonine-protein kinase DDB_G0280111, partial [Durusdinium trenchii]